MTIKDIIDKIRETNGLILQSLDQEEIWSIIKTKEFIADQKKFINELVEVLHKSPKHTCIKYDQEISEDK